MKKLKQKIRATARTFFLKFSFQVLIWKFIKKTKFCEFSSRKKEKKFGNKVEISDSLQITYIFYKFKFMSAIYIKKKYSRLFFNVDFIHNFLSFVHVACICEIWK